MDAFAHMSAVQRKKVAGIRCGDQLIGKVQRADSNGLALSESTGTVSKWAFLAVISRVSKLHSRAVQAFSHLLK